MFRALKRLVFKVDDLEQARQWYADILDSEPVYSSPAAAIFQVGDCSLSLAQANGPLPPAGARIDIYWDVDDVAATMAQLEAKGAQVLAPLRDVLEIRTVLLLDPFGNRIGLTSPVPVAKAETVADRPSQTALTVALSRALAAREERTALRGPDDLADLFLPAEAKPFLESPVQARWVIDHQLTAPLYAYFLARTAYLDAQFTAACRDGVDQVVFLGAGYDTRPYRFRDNLGITRVFELDSAPTQQRKRDLLARAGVPLPACLTYVPIDFERETMSDRLLQAGFDPRCKTLFIWEGVTYYLSESAVVDTLRFIAGNAPTGSQLCFDYLQQKLESINAAEPFRFWIARDQLPVLLSSHGFDLVEELDARALEQRYLTLPDGTLGERVMTRFGIVRASVR